jgi:hypothetical protein
MNILQLLTPRVPRRTLLFIAALVWTFAGSMLFLKGMGMVRSNPNHLILVITGSVIGGLLFYLAVFSKISLKHTRRIINLQNEKPCFFSFFNLKSYLLMSLMISSGIILRTTGIVAPKYLSVVYLTMGVPLFISAFRFYYYGIFYELAQKLKITLEDR